MNRAICALFVAACGGANQGTTTSPATSSDVDAAASAMPTIARGAMKDVSPTIYADDLRAAGLDPLKLPQLNKLPPEQLRKVMPLVAKSLGVKCTA